MVDDLRVMPQLVADGGQRPHPDGSHSID